MCITLQSILKVIIVIIISIIVVIIIIIIIIICEKKVCINNDWLIRVRGGGGGGGSQYKYKDAVPEYVFLLYRWDLLIFRRGPMCIYASIGTSSNCCYQHMIRMVLA